MPPGILVLVEQLGAFNANLLANLLAAALVVAGYWLRDSRRYPQHDAFVRLANGHPAHEVVRLIDDATRRTHLGFGLMVLGVVVYVGSVCLFAPMLSATASICAAVLGLVVAGVMQAILVIAARRPRHIRPRSSRRLYLRPTRL